MRHWERVMAVLAIGATACAPQTGVGEHYPQRDRHAVVFLFPVDGRCKVIGAPETHIAFPGKKVIWRVVNLCAPGTEIELIFDRREPESAPPNPFSEAGGVESKGAGFTFSARVEAGFAPGNTFARTVKGTSEFPRDVESKYFYKVGIKDDPSSRIEPEMDIWP
jgi:hypothetical protein